MGLGLEDILPFAVVGGTLAVSGVIVYANYLLISRVERGKEKVERDAEEFIKQLSSVRPGPYPLLYRRSEER